MNEQDKSKLGADTLKSFFDQFGNDEIGRVFIEVLCGELMHAKVVSILSQSEQERDQVDNDSDGPVPSDISADGSGLLGTATGLATKDPSDHS